MYYSKSRNAWFSPELKDRYENAGNWPADAEEYPREIYDAVVSNRPAGKIMAPDENGHPVLLDIPKATPGQMWELIKAERDRRKNLGFPCTGHWYHSDAESKTQHLGNKDTARDQIAAGAQPADPLRDPITNQPIVWKTMSGQFVPLTCALAIDIVAAGKSAEFATFAAAEAHRAAMEASPDPAAYDFSGGWPPVFGE